MGISVCLLTSVASQRASEVAGILVPPRRRSETAVASPETCARRSTQRPSSSLPAQKGPALALETALRIPVAGADGSGLLDHVPGTLLNHINADSGFPPRWETLTARLELTAWFDRGPRCLVLCHITSAAACQVGASVVEWMMKRSSG